MAHPRKYFSEADYKYAKKKWDSTYLSTPNGKANRLAYRERMREKCRLARERVNADPVLNMKMQKKAREYYLDNCEIVIV